MSSSSSAAAAVAAAAVAVRESGGPAPPPKKKRKSTRTGTKNFTRDELSAMMDICEDLDYPYTNVEFDKVAELLVEKGYPEREGKSIKTKLAKLRTKPTGSAGPGRLARRAKELFRLARDRIAQAEAFGLFSDDVDGGSDDDDDEDADDGREGSSDGVVGRGSPKSPAGSPASSTSTATSGTDSGGRTIDKGKERAVSPKTKKKKRSPNRRESLTRKRRKTSGALEELTSTVSEAIKVCTIGNNNGDANKDNATIVETMMKTMLEMQKEMQQRAEAESERNRQFMMALLDKIARE